MPVFQLPSFISNQFHSSSTRCLSSAAAGCSNAEILTSRSASTSPATCKTAAQCRQPLGFVHLSTTTWTSLVFLFLQMPHLPRPSDPMEDEPPSKKSRTEDSLVPEQEFLSKHKVLFKFIWCCRNILCCCLNCHL